MPGGGLASINLIDAARRRLVVEATDAFVEVRARLLGVAGEEGGCEFGLWGEGGEIEDGCGNWTGVGVLEDAIAEVMRLRL